LAIARVYLAAHDKEMIERTWSVVIAESLRRAKAKSRPRYERAMRDRAFDLNCSRSRSAIM
jgi:hypothetical protein